MPRSQSLESLSSRTRTFCRFLALFYNSTRCASEPFLRYSSPHTSDVQLATRPPHPSDDNNGFMLHIPCDMFAGSRSQRRTSNPARFCAFPGDRRDDAHSLLQSKFPVSLPDMPQLKLSKDDFAAYIQTLVTKQSQKPSVDSDKDDSTEVANEEAVPQSAFMDSLLLNKRLVPSFDDHDDKMLTENADVAYSKSGSALVDLFYELEQSISASALQARLEKAWAEDADATLKIIWNARSIHLGKSNRNAFYRALGWLYEHHPVTLLCNLQWLVRPVIQKKVYKKDSNSAQKENKAVKVDEKDGKSAQKKDEAVKIDEKDADSDFEMVDPASPVESKKRKLSELESADAEFDVRYGVAHGYWKDLLNLLALAANDELNHAGNPSGILTTEKSKTKKFKRDWTEGRKKKVNEARHETVLSKLQSDEKYKMLHLCVARLFADQLQLDLARLESNDKKEIKKVTLAGKWAPSNKGLHDQHTTIVTSIAELLHPLDSVCPDLDPADRELYIKHARNAYQTFDQIKYERVPSLAMQQYTPLFARKDFDHFDAYIENVAQGKAKISGAVLLPSTLVRGLKGFAPSPRRSKISPSDTLVAQKMEAIAVKSVGAQWNTLVQRIKDSGTLSSSIAVCDVSSSMSSPTFRDKTCPMDSAIGLSLLISEVTEPPFGGAMITFHSHPQVFRVGGAKDTRSFAEKVDYIRSAPWGMNTDFVAVFEKLILPMAVHHKLKPEDMVKQVFVFSDMQFDHAMREQYGGGQVRWMTSYERIQAKFEKHGYEMPKLIFWNLAGGRAGYVNGNSVGQVGGGNPTAPKPVTAAEEGTSLVSGYSQGQLKMFLENGHFDGNEEDEDMVEIGKNGEVRERSKKKDDPLATLQKAIGHDAYRMLKVVD
ncbi:hypothetical protein BST61_g2481 [Cercospora zeina]